jgi:hypothetical protein
MRLIVYLTILFISMPLLAEVNEDLQSQLIKMAQQNQQVRQSLEKYNTENIPPALQTLASQIDKLQTQTLKEIITLHGWPTKKKVGEKGTQAAFILVQHSKNLVFQQDMLPLIIQSFLDKGGIAGKDVARFTDSVSIRLGKKQVFGTQVKWIDGKVVFAPIENEDSVNLLRAQMGMPPLEEYKRSLEAFNLQKYR